MATQLKRRQHETVTTTANKLLDALKELDAQTTRAYYEMGRLIHAITEDKIYKLLGYPSMRALVGEELSYSPSTAGHYASIYRHFQRLEYSDEQALKLLAKYGLTTVGAWLPTASQVSPRTAEKHLKAIKESVRQINFTLKGSEYKRSVSVLQKLGAEIDGQVLKHSSSAFMSLIEQFETSTLRLVK